jgi:hypothetical protein
MKIVLSAKRQRYWAVFSIFLVTVTLLAGMVGCSTSRSSIEIWDWHDLDDIRDNLAASCLLMRNLDSTIDGYGALASETANQGRGWEPIGTQDKPFMGTFDGQGFEISDLFIGRLDTGHVGLFGFVGEGLITNVGVVNAYVVGEWCVGGLVGINWGTLSNSYSDGSFSGSDQVGGLVGGNGGSVTNSYSTGIVTGDRHAGGLVGACNGPVSNCHFAGSVSGESRIGGLIGGISGSTVSNSYFDGSVSGSDQVGGLVGGNGGSVSNSYSTGSVSGDRHVGGLVGASNGPVSNSHFAGSVSGESRIGGLVGGMSGSTVSNSYFTGSVSGSSDQVGGLVGYNYGTVSKSYSSGSVTGDSYTGGLVGFNRDTVKDSYSSANVTGRWLAGGLVGQNRGNVSRSYSAGPVTGDMDVGGLVGRNYEGTVSNSFWDTETSGQHTSDGGTGKATAEMQSIATFSGAGWNIIGVANPGTRNASYTWNIVDNMTYPFLSWQL